MAWPMGRLTEERFGPEDHLVSQNEKPADLSVTCFQG
jgi:hypothetical protein